MLNWVICIQIFPKRKTKKNEWMNERQNEKNPFSLWHLIVIICWLLVLCFYCEFRIWNSYTNWRLIFDSTFDYKCSNGRLFSLFGEIVRLFYWFCICVSKWTWELRTFRTLYQIPYMKYICFCQIQSTFGIPNVKCTQIQIVVLWTLNGMHVFIIRKEDKCRWLWLRSFMAHDSWLMVHLKFPMQIFPHSVSIVI